jgi:hypothetical protein
MRVSARALTGLATSAKFGAHVNVFRAFSVAVRAAARFAVFALVHFGIAEIHQGIDVAVRNGPDGRAFAAIAAVGAAEWSEFLATERCAAIAAIAGDDFDFCFVDKLHIFAAIKLKRLYRGQSLSIEGLRLTKCAP